MLFSPGTVTIDGRSATTGADAPALTSSNPGNPNLRPERSNEIESGFDSQVLSNRVHLEYTYYSKTTHDALISVPIAASAGASVGASWRTLARRGTPGHELR